MDILKIENGYSIIEALVSLVILGILAVLSITIFKGVFMSSAAVLKNEAFYMAKQDIDLALSLPAAEDTAYSNSSANLKLSRKVTLSGELQHIDVRVEFVPKHNEIIKLSASKKKWIM